MDGDGNIDYEEYTKYLDSLELNKLATSMREKSEEQILAKLKINPDDIPRIEYNEDLESIAEELSEKTNLYKYNLKNFLCHTDYPVHKLEFNYPRMFRFIDESTKKYKITILSSIKSAQLWYHF